MTKSELFRKAHALTKKVIQKGDDYRVTFGAALKGLMMKAIKITLTQLRISRRVVREFSSKEEFTKYCAMAFRPELTTYEAALEYCNSSKSITLAVE